MSRAQPQVNMTVRTRTFFAFVLLNDTMYNRHMQKLDSVAENDRLVTESARFLRFLANWWERNGHRVLLKLFG